LPLNNALLSLLFLSLWASAGALEAQSASGRAGDVTVGGRVHAQVATTSIDGGPPVDLFLRRARFTFDVEVNDYIDGRLMPEFSGGRGVMQDAYFRLKLSPGLRISIGQFKRSFDLFELESSTELAMVERDGRIPGLAACSGVGGTCAFSRLTEQLQYAARDLGVRLDGGLGDWGAYEVSLTNGQGPNTRDANQSKSVAGRLAFNAAEGVVLGVGATLHDAYLEDVEETEYAPAVSVDLEVGDYYGGTHVMAALVRGENWRVRDELGQSATFWAAQIVATRYTPRHAPLIQGFEPMVRVSTANPDTGAAEVSGLLLTPGFNVYFQGRNRFGVNLDVFRHSGGVTDTSLKFMTYLRF